METIKKTDMVYISYVDIPIKDLIKIPLLQIRIVEILESNSFDALIKYKNIPSTLRQLVELYERKPFEIGRAHV